ncbi:amidohydrolase family protein [Lentzea tibetensis]|uniref:Amidohydrolase family protein n=1 Tax=Lentzea tibetensis TaxID=2591470 RepID=A0A563EHT7_9PSEU|nr:amidohydrolase family protein [Lentzea tibetensis]TWP45998.1 amidohydrolase family protein [Lentzea tibetensis]
MRGYRADRAFDGERVVHGGALVLVEDGRIAGVEPGDAAVGCPVTHLPGTTLLPGLIDTHVHLCADSRPFALDRIPEMSADELDAVVRKSLRDQLMVGVTAVRDLGDHHFAVVDRHLGGDGPTVVAAGPPITSAGGHCWSMGGEVDGDDEARRAVRERAERGAQVIKVMASGGVMTVTTDVLVPQFSDDRLRLVVDEAHALGLPVVAHAHPVAAIEQCLDAGVDGIEHCTCIGPTGISTPPGLAERIAASGVVVGPTLGHVPGMEPPPQVQAVMKRTGMTLEARLAQVGELHRAGVPMIGGADSGIGPGKPHGILPHAVAHMVGIGMSCAEALASVTGAAAKACGLGDRTGRLRAGLDADLLVVAGDPLTDIAALQQVRLVVSRGVEVDLNG